MHSPEHVATAIVQERGGHGAEAFANIVAAIEADRADREPTVRHIVFTGPFEEAYTMSEAKSRIEELLNEGHETPTVVNAVLHDGEVIGITARKIIDTAKAGEIR